ncbi:MAG: signal peptidase I [Nitrososphaera sp.]|nr:signal peptidase I [Nitrososphaera sp.]
MSEEIMHDTRSSALKRHPWIAVVLAIVFSPFISMLYLGRGSRACGYAIAIWLALIAAHVTARLFNWPWPLGDDLASLAFIIPVWVSGAIDSYKVAKQCRENFSGPWYSHWYSISVIFITIFSFRAFVIEPFRIPSGAMMPTLLIGDYIAVNKYTYGIRLPFTNARIIDIARPERADVIVFRYPEAPSVVFIKRVVGLPGDRIGYHNKKLLCAGRQSR